MFGELGFSTWKSRTYFVFVGAVAKDCWYGVGFFPDGVFFSRLILYPHSTNAILLVY
jgi:hypothetical protein